jgi:hypothetical protein
MWQVQIIFLPGVDVIICTIRGKMTPILDNKEVCQEKVHNREEWQKLLRTARKCHILHMSME